MQSTSLKTARAPFDAGMVRAFITIVGAFALVAGLVLALTIIRGQPGTPVVSKAAVDQALIDVRAGERSLLTPQEQADAEHKAFLDIIASERTDRTLQKQVIAERKAFHGLIADERAVLTPQELLDQVRRADAARWAGAYIVDADTGSAGGGGGVRFPQ